MPAGRLAYLHNVSIPTYLAGSHLWHDDMALQVTAVIEDLWWHLLAERTRSFHCTKVKMESGNSFGH